MDPSRGLQTYSYAQQSDHAGNCWQYSSLDGKTIIVLKPEHAAMLHPGALMTEDLFHFYLLWLGRNVPAQQLSSVHIFSTCLITGMREIVPDRMSIWPENRMAAKFRRWVPPDFLNKQLIFVPVYANVHYTLAIVCFPLLAFTSSSQPAAQHPVILLLDSLDPYGIEALQTAAFLLRNFISDMYNEQKHQRLLLTDENMPVQRILAPLQQLNDCGFCVLYFIEVIVRHDWGENFCNFNASEVEILLKERQPRDMRESVRLAFNSVTRYDQNSVQH
jgi:Ulp1 family protease